MDPRPSVEMPNIHICYSGKSDRQGRTHTKTYTDTHTRTRAEKATEIGGSVTSDYPPATLTWRDWGHMNASVALSDV